MNKKLRNLNLMHAILTLIFQMTRQVRYLIKNEPSLSDLPKRPVVFRKAWFRTGAAVAARSTHVALVEVPISVAHVLLILFPCLCNLHFTSLK